MTVVTWIISSCVLILAVIGIRGAFGKRMRPGLRYALWGIVLLRLLFPGAVFSSPISVQNITQQASAAIAETVRSERARTVAPIIASAEYEQGQSAVTTPALEIAEYAPQAMPRAQESYTTGAKHAATASPTIPASRATETAPAAEPEIVEEEKPEIEVTDVLIAVWAAGTGVTLVLFAISNLRFYLKLRRRRRPIGIDCPLRVYSVEKISSSCLFGNGIYISADTAGDAVKLRHVLAHELSHHRHGDHVWTFLRSFAMAIHWYNPLVWWAAALARNDSELCADAGALKKIGEAERTRYGATLIELSAKRAGKVSLLCTATTMANGKSSLKERVTMIAKRPRMTLAVVLAVAILLSVAAGCAFTGAKAAPISEEETEEPAEPITEPESEPEQEPEPEPELEPDKSAELEEIEKWENLKIIDFDADTGMITNYVDRTVSDIVIPDEIDGVAVKSIYDSSPNSAKLERVLLPASLTTFGYNAFRYCPNLTEINVSENNEVYTSIDGVLYTKDTKTLVRCPSGRSGDFVVPDHVTTIAKWAFSTCDQLESVTIPASVTEIKDFAFSECAGLTEINVAEDNEVYTSIDGVLYTKDKKRLLCWSSEKSGEIEIADQSETIGKFAFAFSESDSSVVIPEGVTAIDEMAFLHNTNLTTITLPKSVTSIGNWAFQGCESLAEVYYGGTEAEWQAIEKGIENDYLLNAVVHFAGE